MICSVVYIPKRELNLTDQAAGKGGNISNFFGFAAMGGEQHEVVLRLSQNGVYAPDYGANVACAEFVYNQPDGVGAPHPQAAGLLIEGVAQLGHGPHDPFALVGADMRTIVEHA